MVGEKAQGRSVNALSEGKGFCRPSLGLVQWRGSAFIKAWYDVYCCPPRCSNAPAGGLISLPSGPLGTRPGAAGG
jgi:hypothetical protein